MRFPVFALALLGCAADGFAHSTGAGASGSSVDRPFWLLREPAPAQTQPSISTPRSAEAADSLARANAILARQIEPAVSRWFLGLGLPGDNERVLDGVRQARGLLAESHADSADQPESPGDLRDQDVEVLAAFARAMENVFAGGENDSDVAERDSAAIQLAVLLEDDRSEVANAARLWRAALFRRLGRHDRVLALLPDPLAGLSGESRRFDFYSRLLRTRSIADQGGYAAACTLLLEIEDKCDEWFPDSDQVTDARRAAAALRCGVLRQWADSLDPAAKSQEHAWCLRAIERIRASACPDADGCPVLPLETAVPVLVGPPVTPTTTRAFDEP